MRAILMVAVVTLGGCELYSDDGGEPAGVDAGAIQCTAPPPCAGVWGDACPVDFCNFTVVDRRGEAMVCAVARGDSSCPN